MQIKIKEKRGSERFTTHGLVKFSCIGSDDLIDGNLVNCSENGICFESCFEMQPGTAVFISEFDDDKFFQAEVVWCKSSDDPGMKGFIVGARYGDAC